MPVWVLLDEFVVGANGLLPFMLLLTLVAGFYMLVRKIFAATRNEAVQSLFVLLFVSFAILTATGVWFRGAGMALVWPWQM